MKSTVKQLAAGTLIALLLLAGNVNAKGTETKTLIRETETTLQVEKWMTDEVLWNTNSIGISGINQITETSLELENWMTSEGTWDLINSNVEETEAGMELESWMTSEETWNSISNIQETETGLTVENWMINEIVWK